MKSGILATTTLLVILGTVEQIQAQTETDRDGEFDVTGFSGRSDETPAATTVPLENDKLNLGWQTDFGVQSPEMGPKDKFLCFSTVAKAPVPLVADFRTEKTQNTLAASSKQFRPHIPSRTATPAPRTEESFRNWENRSSGASRNYSNNAPQRSVAYGHRKFGAKSPLSTPIAARQVAPLSTQQIRQPEIPPLAAAANYLPEAPEEIPETPVFTGYGWPARAVISSGYGWRWGRMHNGIDLAGPVGTPIVAAGDGVVITSEWNTGGYGNLVEIQHPDGTITLYAHNHENRVRVGETVKRGQLIALMGSTGHSTGPHLHFEMHVPGQGAVNPAAYMPSGHSVARQY